MKNAKGDLNNEIIIWNNFDEPGTHSKIVQAIDSSGKGFASWVQCPILQEKEVLQRDRTEVDFFKCHTSSELKKQPTSTGLRGMVERKFTAC